MKTVFILVLCFLGVEGIQSQVSSGKLIHLINFPSQYISARNVDIWLPENYSPKEKYSVLYMHDGQMLWDSLSTWNHQEWKVDETVSRLMQEKKITPTIVVGIWNIPETRHSDLFPQKVYESLSDADIISVQKAMEQSAMQLFQHSLQADNYLRFIVKELKPYIDKNFSTYSQRKHTFIGGSSMGGLISWYALCEYPKVFGGAICMSTHWPGIFEMQNNPFPQAFYNYLDTHLPNAKNHKLYFDYGDQTLDALYPSLQQKMDSLQKFHHYDDQNWKSQFFPGEAHDEKSWSRRLAIPLEFMLGM